MNTGWGRWRAQIESDREKIEFLLSHEPSEVSRLCDFLRSIGIKPPDFFARRFRPPSGGLLKRAPGKTSAASA